MRLQSKFRILSVVAACSVYISAAAPARDGNNLDSIIGNEKLKFVFVGGKGGVGKTTTSSAVAAQLSLAKSAAGSGRRILLISTDPAHSLSDAFRMTFSNTPTPIMPDLPNLEVMEVNPTETMRKELQGWADFAKELGYDPEKVNTGGDSTMTIGEKIHQFQEWLSGIPGIDEATALSSAIEHIESGRYDMIVFDTAPTGHTLKLLELPKLLQIGLDKLEGWQATLWGYYEMFKGFTGGASMDNANVKKKVSDKLKKYKASIGRVSDMITDRTRTRFIVVCIAEFLSISESRRLLGELDRSEVLASHIVVNQLVTDYLEEDEISQLEQYASAKADGDGGDTEAHILSKALAAVRLTTARRNIQSKYLRDLRNSPEVTRTPDPENPENRTNSKAGSDPLTVLEVPLLPSEVTGPRAILDFSHYLVGRKIVDSSAKAVGVEADRSKQARAKEKMDMVMDDKELKKMLDGVMADDTMKASADDILDKVMADEELSGMISKNMKLIKVLAKVKKNPMSVMNYMTNPDVAPFIKRVVDKLYPSLSGMLPSMPAGDSSLGGDKGKKKRKAGKGGNDPGAYMEELMKRMEL